MISDYSVPVSTRFWIKVDKQDDLECWNWLAYKNAGGYGWFFYEGTVQPAHRVSYILEHGSIPNGMELHHGCENPSCVNPLHLLPITPSDHAKLTCNVSTWNSSVTICKRGHPFTPENTGMSVLNQRYCKECKRISNRAGGSTRPPRLRAEYQKSRYHNVPGVAEKRRADQRIRNAAARATMKDLSEV